MENIRGFGEVGIAPDWQSGGQGFKSPKLHLEMARNTYPSLFLCLFLSLKNI